MRWARPDIYNSVRGCARHILETTKEHYHAMLKVMEYIITTPERVSFLASKGEWDGKSPDFQFEISSRSDSDYAKCKGSSKVSLDVGTN